MKSQRPVPARLLALLLVTLPGCSQSSAAPETPAPSQAPQEAVAFPSTYTPMPSRTTLIRNATILTATGPAMQNASLLIRDGKIAAVGTNVTAPADVQVIDGSGMWVTPGIIDTHSHNGDYPSPGTEAQYDGNEATSPNTAQVWAEHSVWPQDPNFALALAGGVTALQVLPGSANLFGGRGVTLKNIPARSVQAMKFPGAPYGLKMACGENPKRVYGDRGGPSTGMANVAGFRAAWIKASKYRDQYEKWRKEGADPSKRPDRDLQSETLAGVLNGDILVHNHCYRADEMVNMIDIAKEFGYSISSFHHAVEAYKIRDILAREDICGSMWSDWYGFKMESFDGIKENIPLMHEAGACTIVHSDDSEGIQRLNQEAAKAMTAGKAHGISVTYEDAIRWLTLNPAKALGIDEWTGSLEAGKMGDVVLWSGDPFSIYTKASKVFIDGAIVYDRADPSRQPSSDFMLGILPPEVVK